VALFFLAGLGLTFTPCVLPMLPILSGVVLRGQIGGMRSFGLSLAYVLPMAAGFAVLGALMGMFGAELNLQARLQSPWILVPFALFFVAFALAMFGLFELRLPQAMGHRLERIAGNARGRFIRRCRTARNCLQPAGFAMRVGTACWRLAVYQRQWRCAGWRTQAVRPWL
jgi:thioredoxin:protein disulfide reductase